MLKLTVENKSQTSELVQFINRLYNNISNVNDEDIVTPYLSGGGNFYLKYINHDTKINLAGESDISLHIWTDGLDDTNGVTNPIISIHVGIDICKDEELIRDVLSLIENPEPFIFNNWELLEGIEGGCRHYKKKEPMKLENSLLTNIFIS